MNNLKPYFFLPFKPQSQLHFFSTRSCNDIIKHFSASGAHLDALLTYSSMLISNTPPDSHTFPCLIKSCSTLGSLSNCFSIHQQSIIHGFSSNSIIASSLVGMYSKLGEPGYAGQIFVEMPERSVVAWSAIIGCYSKMGDVNMAFCFFNEMRNQGTSPNSITVLGLLVGISQITSLECVHACVIRYGFVSDIVLMNSLLNVYGRTGSVGTASRFFKMMDHKDIVSWNSLVLCYSQNGNVREAVEILRIMRTEGFEPDHQTFGSVVSAGGNESKLEAGKMLHGQIVRAGFEEDVQVETTLIAMYLKCGEVDDAFQLFDKITLRDVVSWTSMISGLVQNGRADKSLQIFCQMLISGIRPSTSTIASALAACAQLNSLRHGTSIHGYVVRQRIPKDISAQNSLITMYARCNHLQKSLVVFKSMPSKDVVTWNALVGGHAQSGNLSRALVLLNEMKMAHQRPDSVTVVSLLQACSSLGALQQGQWIHNYVIRQRIGPSISVDTALIDMYSKCGNIETAQRCFNQMPEWDLVSWSTIIAGYGAHGKGEAALKMYSEFLGTGIKPNHVTFLAILSACSHAGLVSQGLRIFESMTQDFITEPTVEHRACMVDLLSRAGRVEEAYDFVKKMFQQPSVTVLGILLDACRSQQNVDLGETIRREILSLKPENAGDYVQLANSYASMRKWDGMREALKKIRELGLKKVPGWSFIQLHGVITTFFVDDSSHPQYEEIMLMLNILRREMHRTNNSHPQ